MARACIFCGGSQLSKEHVFPDWLRGACAPFIGKQTTTRFRSLSCKHRVWPSSSFQATVRKVCSNCNSGWLSELEGRTKALLESLMMGGERLLNSAEQTRLAFWCVKTAIVMDAAQPKPGVPANHAQHICSAGALPANYVITLHTADFEEPYLLFHHQHIGFSATRALSPLMPGNLMEDDGYVSTFRILRFTAQVFWCQSNDRYLRLLEDYGHTPGVIWPV